MGGNAAGGSRKMGGQGCGVQAVGELREVGVGMQEVDGGRAWVGVTGWWIGALVVGAGGHAAGGLRRPWVRVCVQGGGGGGGGIPVAHR